MKNWTTFRYAFQKSLPVMAGYLVLGMGFGMMLEAAGYGIGWALAMSIFIYAGSMQYVVIDLLTGGASLITTALMTVAVNIRHLFYGISMVERYQNTRPCKPYLIFALTDETYSLVCSGEVPEGISWKWYCFFLSLLNQCYWVAGSAAGSAFGSFGGFSTEGIDFSMTALFLVVFLEQWKKHKGSCERGPWRFRLAFLLDFVWAGRISDPVADRDSRPFDGGKTVSREGGGKRWFRFMK